MDMDLHKENEQLKKALRYLIWTKELKGKEGKSEEYLKHREDAWDLANEVIEECNDKDFIGMFPDKIEMPSSHVGFCGGGYDDARKLIKGLQISNVKGRTVIVGVDISPEYDKVSASRLDGLRGHLIAMKNIIMDEVPELNKTHHPRKDKHYQKHCRKSNWKR